MFKHSSKIFKVIVAIVIIATMILLGSRVCRAEGLLSTEREGVAKQIAHICEEHWEEYGIWPSVAVGQAFVESGLGEGPNLFGVKGQSGRSVYDSTISYLETLQNQYFRGEANFANTPESQLALIMRGGRYCEGQYPGGSYYRNVINSIDKYGWREFDAHCKKVVAEKEEKVERKQRQQGLFQIEFTPELPECVAIVDPDYIKKGSTILYAGGTLEATETQQGLENVIIVGTPSVFRLDDWKSSAAAQFELTDYAQRLIENIKFKIEVIEDAKG